MILYSHCWIANINQEILGMITATVKVMVKIHPITFKFN